MKERYKKQLIVLGKICLTLNIAFLLLWGLEAPLWANIIATAVFCGYTCYILHGVRRDETLSENVRDAAGFGFYFLLIAWSGAVILNCLGF